MADKVKTIKEFIAGGAPQFQVIGRGTPGVNVNVVLKSMNDELDLDVKKTIVPPPGKGVIKQVKRINDQQVFSSGSMVEVDGEGSSLISEFSEDLVHCIVVNLFTQEEEELYKNVEINSLTLSELLEDPADPADYETFQPFAIIESESKEENKSDGAE